MEKYYPGIDAGETWDRGKRIVYAKWAQEKTKMDVLHKVFPILTLKPDQHSRYDMTHWHAVYPNGAHARGATGFVVHSYYSNLIG